MGRRLFAFVGLVGSVLVGLASGSVAQSAAPTTPWGSPDLQGIWDFRTLTPLQRPEALADQEFLTEEEAASIAEEAADRAERLLHRPAERTTSGGLVDVRADGSPGFYNNFWLDPGSSTVGTGRTSLVIDPPDGRLPALAPETQRRAAGSQGYEQPPPASWLDLDAGDRCLLGLNSGPPIIPGGYNQNLQVFQTPDHVVLMTEMVHTVRVVPLDGRPRLTNDIRQWSGESRGHWDGETLVIETTNFVGDRRWTIANPMGALGSSEELKLVERLTRIDPNTLEYEFTVHDPAVWSRPWTVSIPMVRSDEPLYEYACHEGNYSLPNMLAGARAAELR